MFTYSNGTYTIKGAGYGVWQNGNIDDQFQFAYHSSQETRQLDCFAGGYG